MAGFGWGTLLQKAVLLVRGCFRDWATTLTVLLTVVRGILAFIPIPVTWDEAVYTNLARDYYYLGFYYYFPFQVVLDFARAPVLPLSIYVAFLLTGPNHTVAQLVTYAYSVAAVYMVYLLGKDMYGERVGCLSALAFSCSPFLLVSSWGVLTEPPFMFFAALFLLSVYRAQRKPYYYVLSGVTLTLTTLTRYPGFLMILVGVFLTVSLGNARVTVRSPWFYAGIGAAVATVTPWLIYSKNVTGAYLGFLQVFFASTQQWTRNPYLILATTPLDLAVSGVYDLIAMAAIPGTLIPYFLWGVKAGRMKVEGRTLIFWVISYAAAYGVLMRMARLVDYLRYNETSLPAVAVLSAMGIAVLLGEGEVKLDGVRSLMAGKRKVALALIAVNFIAGLAGVYVVRSEPGISVPIPVYEYMKATTLPCETILSNVYPMVSYYTDRIAMWFPQVPWLRDFTLKNLNVKYVLFNLYRYCPPDALMYVEAHPEMFERVLVYGGILVYRVANASSP
ncbi:MAG: ArnT family glycosyltransferase [Candidatus Freyarchaeota archaeon]|nr:glycosyltransferase family 39 protein [Candidatus Freyrarchaeum guaymaensis]